MNREILQPLTQRPFWRPGLIVFFVVSILLITPYYYWYSGEARARLTQEGTELTSVAKLKAGEINLWYQERVNDARELSASLHLLQRATGKQSPTTQEPLFAALLDSFAKSYRYPYTAYYGPDKKLIATSLGHAMPRQSAIRRVLGEVEQQRRLVFLDLLTSEGDTYELLLIGVPVGQHGSKPAGYLILAVSTVDFLFPTVTIWPNESKHSQSALVRYSGDTVFVLNAQTAKSEFRVSSLRYEENKQLPVMRYLAGERGIISGMDYRGKEVIVHIDSVSGTPWHLLVKSDTDVVLRELNIRAVYAAIIIVLSCGLAIFTFGYIQWHRRQRQLQQQLEQEKHTATVLLAYEHLFEQANDSIIISDHSGTITEINEHALATYGYTRQEILGMPVRLLFTGEGATESAARLLPGNTNSGQVFEALHQTKAGELLAAEISSKPLLINGIPRMQSIVRDITLRKQDELHIKRLTRFLTVLSGVNKAIISIKDRKELADRVCQILQETGKITEVQILSVHPVSNRLEIYSSYGITTQGNAETYAPVAGEGWFGRLLHTGGLHLFHRPEEVPEPWFREFVFKPGITSVLASVITLHPKVNGVLICSSNEQAFFNKEETDILKEISDDISYGLRNIHIEQQRRKTEELLKRSQKLLQETGKIAKIGGWEYDFIKKAGRWTEEVANIFGTDETFTVPAPEELPFYSVQAGELLRAAIAQSIAEQSIFDVEAHVTTEQGAQKWVRIIGRPSVVEGAVHQMYCSVQDITQLKLAQQGLEESEKRYRLLAENISDVIWSYDLTSQKFTYISPSIKALRGITPEEAMAESLQDALLPESLQMISAATPPRLAEFLAGNPQKHTDVVLQPHKNGTSRWIEIHSMFATNPENGHTEVIATSRDVTDKLLDEQKLRESEEQYHSLFANMLNGLAHFEVRESSSGKDIVLLDANEAFLRLNGIGTLPGRIAVTDWLQEKKEWLLSQFSSVPDSTGKTQLEAYNDQEHTWLLISIYVPRQHQYIVITEDITEQKNAQEALRLYSTRLEATVEERTAQLQRANKELESFSYSVSHDLRAPLRAINGFSRILQSDYTAILPADAADLLSDIQRNAVRMTQLIDDLLEFSRMSRKEINRTVVPMKRLFTDVYKELTEEIGGREIVFSIADVPDAFGDYTLLRQVIINLLSNAIKYTAKRDVAEIQVSGHQTDAATVYTVEDNGAGFDMKYAEKLFGVFSRLHGVDEFDGTGVGLAIVKRILLHHGGDITAYAEVKVGASFTFTIPLKKEQP